MIDYRFLGNYKKGDTNAHSAKIHNFFVCHKHIMFNVKQINKPGVARAALQTPMLSFSKGNVVFNIS